MLRHVVLDWPHEGAQREAIHRLEDLYHPIWRWTDIPNHRFLAGRAAVHWLYTDERWDRQTGWQSFAALAVQASQLLVDAPKPVLADGSLDEIRDSLVRWLLAAHKLMRPERFVWRPWLIKYLERVTPANADQFRHMPQCEVLPDVFLASALAICRLLGANRPTEIEGGRTGRMIQLTNGDAQKTLGQSDTTSDSRKKSLRPVGAAAGACAEYVRDMMRRDRTARLSDGIRDFIESCNGVFHKKPLSKSSLYRTLTDHPDLWKPTPNSDKSRTPPTNAN